MTNSLLESAFEVESSSLQLGLNSGCPQFPCPAARDYDQRSPCREHRAQPYPEAFAHPPLDPVSDDRLADPPRDRRPEPSAVALREFRRVDHEMRGLVARTDALKAKELAAAPKLILRAEAEGSPPPR